MKRRMSGIVMALALATAVPVMADSPRDPVVQQMQQFDELLDAGQGQQAVALLQSMKVKHADHPHVLACEAQVLMLQNRFPDAVKLLNAVLEKEPNHVRASAVLAGIEFRQGKGDAAGTRIDAALNAHPNAPELLQMAAELRAIREDKAGALVYWQRLADAPSAHAGHKASAYAQLAAALIEANEHAKAAALLKQAVDLRWHPNIAFALIQQLQLSGQRAEALAQVKDFREKFNLPQLAQARAQAMAQLTPIEIELKLEEIDEKLAANESNITISSDIRSLQYQLVQVTDPQVKAGLESKIALRQMDNEVNLLKSGIEKKFSSLWLVQRADEIEKLATGLSGPRVDAALAQAADARVLAAEADKELVAVAMEFAQQGWTIPDFSIGHGEKSEQLAARGLPKNYRDFTPAVRAALKAYYEPLAAKREQLELETAVEAFIKSPADVQLQNRVVELLLPRIKDINVNEVEIVYERVIPARVWVEHHGKRRSLNIDEALNDKRELSYTLWSDLESSAMKRNSQWDTWIQGTTFAINTYPRWTALNDRSFAHLYKGDYKAAYRDAALAVAVSVWEQANSIGSPDISSGDWAKEAIPMVLILRDIAENTTKETGLYPSAAIARYLKAVANGSYDEAAMFLTSTDFPDRSLERRLASDVRFSDMRKKEMLDALAARYEKATTDAERQEILDRGDRLSSYNHAGFQLIQWRRATDDEKRKVFLESTLRYNPRHVEASYELARMLENAGEKTEAMLSYNVAAAGQPVGKLTGIAQKAAVERDRLEGNLADFNAAVAVYEPLVNDYAQRVAGVAYANQCDAGRYEAIVKRLQTFNVNKQFAWSNRTDACRAMNDHPGTIEALTELLKEEKANVAVGNFLLGLAYADLAQYATAVEYFGQAIEAGYASEWAHYQRAMAYKQLGQRDNTLADLTEALTKNPDNTAALDERSQHYEYIEHKYEQALADAEKALELLREDNPDGNFFELELRTGNLNMMILEGRINSAFSN